MMQSVKKSFLLNTAILVSLSVFSFILFRSIFKDFYFTTFPLLLTFVYIITVSFHIALYFIFQRKNKENTPLFTLSLITIKLLVYMIFVVTYMFTTTGNAVPFAVSFFVIYIAFTVPEVWLAVRFLKSI